MRPRRPRTDTAELRALLAAQSDQAAAETVAAGGQVSAERLDQLGRLARLVELRDAAAASAPSRWTVPLVAAGTLASLSVLLFARVSTTEVELDLSVSELSFVVPALAVITDGMELSALGVSGLTGIELPPGDCLSPAGPPGNVLLAAAGVGSKEGSVTLDPITLPAGGRVFLRQEEGRHRYRIGLHGATSDLGVSIRGPVRVVVSPALDSVKDFSFPRRVTHKPDSDQVLLDLLAPDTSAARLRFRSPLPADSLFLFRLDQFHQPEQTLTPEVPTIRSGTLYFESIDGQARPLRPGEGLHLAWSGGEMRELALSDTGILVRFHGMVRGMTAGSGEVRRSLMPTLLDWLRARHGLSLLWATTAYLVGLFVAILGWWRRPG